MLDAFISGNNPFGGEWLETDDGQYLRKSAIVRAFYAPTTTLNRRQRNRPDSPRATAPTTPDQLRASLRNPVGAVSQS